MLPEALLHTALTDSLVDQSHRELDPAHPHSQSPICSQQDKTTKHLRSKRPRTDRHGPQQRRPDAPPEPGHALSSPRLREAVSHALVLLVRPEAVALHLALHHVEGVATDPERFARQPAVKGHLERADLIALNTVPPGICIHEVLERGEPNTVRLGFAEECDRRPAIRAAEQALVRRKLSYAVDGAVVQPAGAMRLRLQPDANVLDGARKHRVGDARKGARRVILTIAEVGGTLTLEIAGLKSTSGVMEAAELDRDAGADAHERGERTFVERERAFIPVDLGRSVERTRVLLSRLESDFDNVEWLSWMLSALASNHMTFSSAIRPPWPNSSKAQEMNLPNSTCATPPTAPENRSFTVLLNPCSGASSSASTLILCPPNPEPSHLPQSLLFSSYRTCRTRGKRGAGSRPLADLEPTTAA